MTRNPCHSLLCSTLLEVWKCGILWQTRDSQYSTLACGVFGTLKIHSSLPVQADRASLHDPGMNHRPNLCLQKPGSIQRGSARSASSSISAHARTIIADINFASFTWTRRCLYEKIWKISIVLAGSTRISKRVTCQERLTWKWRTKTCLLHACLTVSATTVALATLHLK